MIFVCKKCNRLKVGEGQWGAAPSTKKIPESKTATHIEACPVCETGGGEGAKDTAIAGVEDAAPKHMAGDGVHSDLAHENHNIIIACKKMMGAALIEFSNALRSSKENEYYKLYNESWEAYLASSELGIDRSRASRLIRLSMFCEAYKKKNGELPEIDDIAEGRICRLLLPSIDMDDKNIEIKNIDAADDLIEKARTLGHDDFAAECDEHRNKERTSDEPPAEKRITEGPVHNAQGEIIGTITSVYANQRGHTLKMKIDNESILDESMTIVIP